MVGVLHCDLLAVILFQMFKGPNQDIESIFTAPVSAVCGVTLEASGKKEYLISGVFILGKRKHKTGFTLASQLDIMCWVMS